jgi:thiol-disulfide isomerase/thioredoxin
MDANLADKRPVDPAHPAGGNGSQWNDQTKSRILKNQIMNRLLMIPLLFPVLIMHAQNGHLKTIRTDRPVAGSFILNGKITGAHKKYMRLYYTDSVGAQRIDSSLIEDGAFVFKGSVSEPTDANLYADRNNWTPIFLDPGTMSVTLTTGDFDNAVVTGSHTQDEQMELNKLLQPVKQEMKPLKQAYDKANEAYMQAVKDKIPEAAQDSIKELAAGLHNGFEPFIERMDALTYVFFEKHPRSYITATNLLYHVGALPLDSLLLFYDRLGPVIRQGATGKELARQIRSLRAGSPGSMAADFTAMDIKGNPLHLSDFRGRYILLDFWASWCVPCRHGNPHLRQVFRKYHDAGFDIIGIADDDYAPPAWKAAVEKDSIGIWHHVLRGYDRNYMQDKKENPNDISEKFGIQSLPTKILIDRNGKIIGRFDSEEGPLDDRLSKIFDK